MTRLSRWALAAPLLIALAAGPHAKAAPAVQASDFAWRATLQTPGEGPLWRVGLPASALMALQSRGYGIVKKLLGQCHPDRMQ
ncbi:MAG: hypothetical protein ACT4NV_13905 [Rhodoferax sp.]